MLTHPILTKLQELKFCGMYKALTEQMQQGDIESFDFYDRLGFLVDREMSERESRKLKNRLSKAKLKQPAALEDIDYTSARGLDKSLIRQLASCAWIKEKRNILIVGATGTGKTYLGCAFAHKSCLEGYTARYLRLPRLLAGLAIYRGDGSYDKYMHEITKANVLIIDDFGLTPMSPEQLRDLLEIVDDRHDRGSTIVTSQLPIKLWHEAIGDTTLADAILDRLIHNSYRLELKGESMRKNRAKNILDDNIGGKLTEIK
jgi:DNA replication protein DnaC